jgi:hypothetical protein
MGMQDDTRISSNLIGANKVEGTKVFNQSGEELGKIHEIMIEKRSGNVAYAVMAFGGYLGMGEKYCPLPWSALTYDMDLGGYVADINKERLKGAPEYNVENPPWDPAYEERVRQYYAAPYRS